MSLLDVVIGVPAFGALLLEVTLVACAYAFVLAVLSGTTRPRWLPAARQATYAVVALVAVAVLMLAYAFVSHDFRLSYVARYSDRSMSPFYLLTSLWGGQDGSLLWWLFLLGGFVAATLFWMKGRYRELAPWVLATLLGALMFFTAIVIFPASPFALDTAGGRPDGEGLNPLLQNYWMVIHPPVLYTGFIACTVPFAFAIAALVTGRLDAEWVIAVRKWMLFAWAFLTLGNVLGMAWAYEELGWGGYWAWDPVENAGVLPWFTASAYVHSTIVQERRGLMKRWNMVLVLLTYFLTIFGTFLTRSGFISSVHSFARSEIGTWFVVYMALIVGLSVALLVRRWGELRSDGAIESLASREAGFVANNWLLVGFMAAVVTMTLVPKITEYVGTPVSFGPMVFNAWLAPVGLLLFALMGITTVLGWRRTSTESLWTALRGPVAFTLLVTVLHVAFGSAVGMPAIVWPEGAVGATLDALRTVEAPLPLVTTALVAFNLAVIAREFAVGAGARRAAAARRGAREGWLTATFSILVKHRRRYGGYVVHLGLVLLMMAFNGANWSVDHEVTMRPGDTHQIAGWTVHYLGPRMCPGSAGCSPDENRAEGKRMLMADIEVRRGSGAATRLSPARHVFEKARQMPTTEAAILRGPLQDFYAIVGVVDPVTKRADFVFHVNPFVTWIAFGVVLMLAGATISLLPDVEDRKLGAWAWLRFGAATASTALFGLYLASSVAVHGAARAERPAPPPQEAAP